ncbi:MAG TPA: septal ring lytic transglycosylase RlpA family protein [Solirubrobacteraceae bacterium]|nr:septal ring lytic transglycosylase RlpA family protein [Solirubrobacteraceae bacterium]
MRLERHKTLLVLAVTAAASLSWPAAGCAADAGGASAAPAQTGSSTRTPAASAPAKTRPGGIATLFGPGLYGRHTACGQTLTPTVVGVASRTLPCGTLIDVTYEGRTLTVPVLDRGPYRHGVTWDLTFGAAAALGITETTRIATRVIGRTANTPTLGLPPGAVEAALEGGALAA